MAVRFIIPIRHPEGVPDLERRCARLGETLASLAAQTSSDWTATIVANPTQILPPLPPRVRVLHVDLPPNAALSAARTRQEVFAAIQLDKGRRIRAAMPEVAPDDLVTVVDDDDLVHRDLVAFVTGQDRGCGWVIKRGYWWASGSRLLVLTDRFHERCGTSLLVPPRYYGHVSGALAGEAALEELGSHKLIFGRLPLAEPTWRTVPFPAAIYRLQPGYASGSSGTRRGGHRPPAGVAAPASAAPAS